MKINRRVWILPVALAGVHTILVGVVALFQLVTVPEPLYRCMNWVFRIGWTLDQPLYIPLLYFIDILSQVGLFFTMIVLGAIYWFIIGVILSLPIAFYLSRKKPQESTLGMPPSDAKT